MARGMPDFVGRTKDIAVLNRLLEEVRRSSSGRLIALRGRRQVGKSRLIEVFCERSSVSVIYFQATRKRAPGAEIDEFRRLASRSLGDRGSVLAAARFRSWDGALAAVAEAVVEQPTIVVIDELPWLIEQDASVEGALQTAWDRYLKAVPVLVILIGSDLTMMAALSEYGRPLYDRARIMVVNPLAPSEVSQLIQGGPVDTLDAYVVVGGFPNLVRELARARNLRSFLYSSLQDATSPLIVAGERALASEFPPDANARAVLGAIGAGEREHKNIASESGIGGATLDRALVELVTKQVVARHLPYSVEAGGRRSRYLVVDPYLRFWLRYLGPALPEIERGRGDLVFRRVLDDMPTFAGRSIEPVVREAITRLLPDRRFGSAQYVGAYWTRDGSVEVDIVGGQRPDRAVHVELIGSIKWRQRSPFDQRDLGDLSMQRSRVPGAGPRTRLVAVSRSGYTCHGLTHTLGPADLLAAW